MSIRFCLLLMAAVSAFAQDYRARIQGIVTDSSNASVASAKVTLRNINTGISASRETGANGAYLFDNVEPGIDNRQHSPFIESQARMADVETDHVSHFNVVARSDL